MRSLTTVIESIIPLIPEKGYERLRDKLNLLQDAVNYTAPEAMASRWMRLSKILLSELGPPAGETWKEEICDLFITI